MKKIITALLMTSSLSVSANNAEFTTMQLQQVDEVRTAALKSHLSYELLESLTTEVGPRLPGTENDKKAVAWAKAKFNELGFDKVWLEEATFPKSELYPSLFRFFEMGLHPKILVQYNPHQSR
mgnify:CR=1 FL=1